MRQRLGIDVEDVAYSLPLDESASIHIAIVDDSVIVQVNGSDLMIGGSITADYETRSYSSSDEDEDGSENSWVRIQLIPFYSNRDQQVVQCVDGPDAFQSYMEQMESSNLVLKRIVPKISNLVTMALSSSY